MVIITVGIVFIYNEKNVTRPVTFPANGTEESPPYSGQTKTAVFDPVYDGRTGPGIFSATEWAIG